MAYTNAVFHIDYDGLSGGTLGSDAVRATQNVTCSNSGGLVNVNSVAHGQVTGAIGTLAAVSNNTGAWKITVVDADNFTLDTSVWSAMGDATGTWVPFGGMNWADAWATVTNGATAARIAPGDEIRIAKSPAPVSVGNADWADGPLPATQTITSSTNATPIVVTRVAHGYATGDILQITGHTTNTNANGVWKIIAINADTYSLTGSVGNGVGGATGTSRKINNRVVYLDTAQTADVDRCETAWTVQNTSTVTTTTTCKEGQAALSLTKASYVANTRYAYKALAGATDYSGYQKISFWWRNSIAQLATHWTICLCSDAAGVTVVDTFVVPAMPSTARYGCFTVARNGGGNLGASIQSVAIYSGSVAPTNANIVFADNIIACTASGLNLQSLISKNSAEQGGTETWYGIQSIVGRFVMLDTETNTTPTTTTARGYSGTTENCATYKRETTKTTMASSSAAGVHTVNDSGTLAGGNITFSGGWDPVSGLQDSETIFDGQNGNGVGVFLSTKNFVTIDMLGCVRFNHGIQVASSPNNRLETLCGLNNNTTYGLYFNSSHHDEMEFLAAANCNGNYGVAFESSSADSDLGTLQALNGNGTDGLLFSPAGGNTIGEANAANNAGVGIRAISSSRNNHINGGVLSGNFVAAVGVTNGCSIFLRDVTMTGTEYSTSSTFDDSRVYSNNHNLTGYDKIFTDGGTITSEATTFAGRQGKAWRLAVTSANRASNYPLDFPIAKIAVAAKIVSTINATPTAGGTGYTLGDVLYLLDTAPAHGASVTVTGVSGGVVTAVALASGGTDYTTGTGKATAGGTGTGCTVEITAVEDQEVTIEVLAKKTHATNIVGRLVVRGGQIAGVAADVTDTLANDTTEQTLSIAFTPTEGGVVELEAWAEYSASTGDVLVGPITVITQE